MITPKQLLEKADKLFYKVVTTHFRNESLFPLTIPCNKQTTGAGFNQLRRDLVPLHQASKLVKGKGYIVDWKEKRINGSIQSVPSRIYFQTLTDFLFFVKRVAEFEKIENARQIIITKFPALNDWTANHPRLLLEYADDWADLMKVCDYFTRNPPPHPLYVRELPIQVHSKFIEQRADILIKLLDQLLPEEWVNLSARDFVSRYSLKKINVYTQIRVLDDELKPYLGYDECSLTIDDAAWLKWAPRNVFIIENQTCYLTFPNVKNSVAIFGEGFKSRLSRHLPWIERTNLYCWFDLDAAGFEMLNMVREHYRNAISVLMDKVTFQEFITFTVPTRRKERELPYLSQDEYEMYSFLVQNGKRLEQERISQSCVQALIDSLNE